MYDVQKLLLALVILFPLYCLSKCIGLRSVMPSNKQKWWWWRWWGKSDCS